MNVSRKVAMEFNETETRISAFAGSSSAHFGDQEYEERDQPGSQGKFCLAIYQQSWGLFHS